jgi:hypothetical protein
LECEHLPSIACPAPVLLPTYLSQQLFSILGLCGSHPLPFGCLTTLARLDSTFSGNRFSTSRFSAACQNLHCYYCICKYIHQYVFLVRRQGRVVRHFVFACWWTSVGFSCLDVCKGDREAGSERAGRQTPPSCRHLTANGRPRTLR